MFVTYPFPSDIQRRVQAQMETGQYNTEDDVLRDAIATLETRQRGLSDLQDMVREADEDIAAGRVGTFNADATKAAVRESLRSQGIVD